MTANTLAQQIEDASVGFDQLDKQYRPMIKLAQELLGIVPNCFGILEIWHPGFRSYNLLVPNLLNLPGMLFGQGAPKVLVGLAMYAASRAAECMYCSAHTCTLALRRGTSPEALIGSYAEVEAAAVAVAEGMARVPATLTRDQIIDLREHLDDDEVEWIVLAVALMGFLNKFMDTMGIELEAGAINDVEDLIGDTGWTPGKHVWTIEDIDGDFGDGLEGRPLRASAIRRLPPGSERAAGVPQGQTNGEVERTGFAAVPQDSAATYLRVLRQAPGAIRKDRQWTKGVSGRAGLALMMLEDELGYAYGTLASLNHNRPVRAIATVIRDNLDAEKTTIGLGAKCLIALVYARVVGNEVLTAEAVQMAERIAPHLGHRILTGVGRFASADSNTATIPPGLSSVEAAVVMLAKAGAPSPSEVNKITIATATNALTPEQVVETVVWLAVQQLLHRLYVFYDVDNGHFYEDLSE